MNPIVTCDLHFGVKNNSKDTLEYQLSYFEQFLFPEMFKRKIDTLIITGDLLENRNMANFGTIDQVRSRFFDKLQDMGVKVFVVLGNHDIFNRNNLHINSPELLFSDYDNVEIVKNPMSFVCNNQKVDLIPWVCSDNYEEIEEYIKSTNSSICLGHFELSDFEIASGVMSHKDTFDRELLLTKYDHIYSGHFHIPSDNGKITYIGSPYYTTWTDCSSKKRVLELAAQEFIKTPDTFNIYNRIKYSDGLEFDTELNERKQYFKIVLPEVYDRDKFQEYLDKLSEVNHYDINVIESTSFESDEDYDLDDPESVLSLSTKFIQESEGFKETEVEELVALNSDIYKQAVEIGGEDL